MINMTTLRSLSKELEQHNITWGVGGSYLLQLHDLYSEPNDLDLWVQPCDIPKIREIFKNYDEIITNIPLPEDLHYKIMYMDLEVDFVACFVTKPNQYEFTYNIKPENIKMISHDGLEIPCTYLEDWYIVYRLLKKDDKANLIKDVFIQKKIYIDEEAIYKALNNQEIKLPIKLKKDVYNLITTATQMSLFDYQQER